MMQSYPTPPSSSITRTQQPSTDNLVSAGSLPSLTQHYPLHGVHTPTTPYPLTSSAASPIFSYNTASLLESQGEQPLHINIDDSTLAQFPQPPSYLSQPSPALSTSAASPTTYYPTMPTFTPSSMNAQVAVPGHFPSLSVESNSPSSPVTSQAHEQKHTPQTQPLDVFTGQQQQQQQQQHSSSSSSSSSSSRRMR